MAEPGRPPRSASRRTVLLGGVGTAAVAAGGGLAWRRTRSTADAGAATPKPASAVVFTTTGAAFSPVLELRAGAAGEVVWRDPAGSVLGRGPTPTIEFGSPAVRKVVLHANPGSVLTLNLGFSSQDDAGRHSLGPEHDRPPVAVSGISGLSHLTGLRRFLAARGELRGSLDLSGLSALEHVECFAAKVRSIDLAGCTSLVRLCVEENDLRSLDLNPVAATVRDVRAAAQAGGSLAFAELDAPMPRLYHFCVRDQSVTGHPTSDQLPACEELWNWSSGQAGRVPRPGTARSVMAAGNGYTTADFSGQWQYDAGWGLLDLTGNRLTSIDVTGCRALQTLKLGDNALDRESVDALLVEVASWGTPGFDLVVDGSNSAPSATGAAAVAALRARGWNVVVAA